MNYHSITLQTTSDRVAPINQQLEDLNALALSVEDAADEPLLEPAPGEVPLWRDAVVTAYFAETQDLVYLSAQLSVSLTVAEVDSMRYQYIADEDWQLRWQQSLQSLEFKSKNNAATLCIRPTVMAHNGPIVAGEYNIYLDPGLAFGTGAHPTTAMCLQYCVDYPMEQQYVMDFGCGSGILALAALRLGAAKVWAIDHDLQARQATKDNALINGFNHEQLQIWDTNSAKLPNVDLLLANILAKPLIYLASLFAQTIKAGGHCILSGLLASQKDIVWQAYAPYFQAPQWQQEGDWMMLIAERI